MFRSAGPMYHKDHLPMLLHKSLYDLSLARADDLP